MVKNEFEKSYGSLWNDLEKTYGCFKYKSSVELTFYISYTGSKLFEFLEKNFWNGKNVHMLEIPTEIIFFFEILIKVCEGLT